VSNTLEIEVHPADATWVAEQIARSVDVLRNGRIRALAEYESVNKAAEQLGLLDEPAAWRASLDVLPVGDTTLLTRLTDTRDPMKVCQLMQARVTALEQSVSRHYLEVLKQICNRANVDADASAALAGSLARKQPEVRMAALQALLEYIRQKQAADPPLPEPAWARDFYREFARAYGRADTHWSFLLNMFASTAPAETVVPFLESVLNAWKPGDYYEAAHSAIRSLHRLDRARAHARLLAELTKPQTWLDSQLIPLLPPSAVPAMDDALIRALADAQRDGGWNPQLRTAALAKYATPKALERIKAIHESQQDECQPELMAYFVRVDPAFADRLLQSQISDMHAPAPPCTTQYFARTAPLAMHPVFEKYIAAYLNHGTVMVKMLATRALGNYGSPVAREPLWAAYRYFHEYWKGKKTALEENGEGVVLEVELRNALSRGANWRTSEAELHTIESLCISDQCLSETQGDLRASQPPLES
jgi:DNA-binding GntR family transcriptional regulator